MTHENKSVSQRSLVPGLVRAVAHPVPLVAVSVARHGGVARVVVGQEPAQLGAHL